MNTSKIFKIEKLKNCTLQGFSSAVTTERCLLDNIPTQCFRVKANMLMVIEY